MSNGGASNNNNGQRIEALSFDAPLADGKVNDQTNVDRQNTSQPQSNNAAILVGHKDSPWWHSQFNLMLAVFGLLALAAVLLVVVTPAPDLEKTITTTSSPDANVTATSNEQSAPWSESRRAQARADSQAVLSNLLDSKKSLEQKRIQEWGATEFEQALSKAQVGDEFYKQQDYAQAINSYQSAVDQLDQLYQRIPELVEQKNSEGSTALEQGKSALALAAFTQALEFDPNNITAASGLDRAKSLDQVLQLLQAAAADEQRFLQNDELNDLLAAQEKLTQALTIDNAYKKAQLARTRVQEQLTDKQFRDAMSQGFSALFANRYAKANKAFAAALKFKPDDKTAKASYTQSLASNKTSSLQSLLNSAQRFEGNEDWQNALSNYQAVLQRDPNQVNAKLGEIRSKARAGLDKQLRDLLSDTLSLNKVNTKAQANKLLGDAKAIKSKGPKLKQQIATLEQSLKQSDAVLKVQLLSDALTDVTLTKVGASKLKLGKFTNKNMGLKPGRYVVSGVRLGFKDTRKEIELYPQASGVQKIDIRCDIPVASVQGGA